MGNYPSAGCELIHVELDTHAANPPAPTDVNILTLEAAHQQKMKLYKSLLNIVEPVIGLKTGEMDDGIRKEDWRR